MLTQQDLQKIGTLIDLRLEVKLETKLNEKLNYLPSKAHFDKRMDDLSKEI